MSLEEWVALSGTILSFIGLIVVFLQLRANAWIHLSDISREILSMALVDPELMKVLKDQEADPEKTETYLQIWFNHFGLVHGKMRMGFYGWGLRKKLEKDIAYFMTMKNAQKHWGDFGTFYPASFQKFLKKSLPKPGLKKSTTNSAPDAQSSQTSPEAS